MSYSLAFSQAIKISIYIYIKTQNGNQDYLSTRAISQYLGIPAPTVSKVLSLLISAGILDVKEGSRGGMLLRRAPDCITLFELFEAVENKKPLFKNEPNKLSDDEKAILVLNQIDVVLTQAETAMKEELRKTSLADLIHFYKE